MQTRRSASPNDGFWPVESQTRTNRYRYSPTNPAGGMVERPTGRTRRTLQGEWSSDQQVPPDAEIREPRRRVLARGIGDQDESLPVFPDEPCRGNGRATNGSHPTNHAGGMVERPTGRTRRTLQGECP